MQVDISHLRKWIGKTETATDLVTPAPIAALSATLDIEAPHPLAGDVVLLLWHWLYFLETHRQSELGPDGHAKLGGFLPPVPLPRRMWAGGRFEFMRPLRVGETFTRTSRIVDVQEKKGRTGTLVFVLVRHEIGNSEGIALVEEQDLVYRDHAKPGDHASAPQPAPAGAMWERTRAAGRCASLPLLRSHVQRPSHSLRPPFRHRNRRISRTGCPWPADCHAAARSFAAAHARGNVSRFEFRAVSPLFDISPFKLFGKPENDAKTISLWATDSCGGLAMTAIARIA